MRTVFTIIAFGIWEWRFKTDGLMAHSLFKDRNFALCLFSIFVSFKEGWGLPIGESLWFGRPVICSNVSSMPEVGGNLAEYVNPYSLASIEEAVIKLSLDNEYREQKCRQIAQAHLRSWSDVALDLSQLLTQSINYKGRRHAHAG